MVPEGSALLVSAGGAYPLASRGRSACSALVRAPRGLLLRTATRRSEDRFVVGWLGAPRRECFAVPVVVAPSCGARPALFHTPKSVVCHCLDPAARMGFRLSAVADSVRVRLPPKGSPVPARPEGFAIWAGYTRRCLTITPEGMLVVLARAARLDTRR